MAGNNETFSWKFYLLIVLVLGALLGLAEAFLGKFIRNAGLPRSPFVAGIGFLIMALGLAVFKKARVIPGITLMGILSKWLAVPILGLPLLCQVNDHFAILLNGAFLFAGVAVFKKHIGSGWKAQSAVAGLAAFGSGATFFALGRFLSPCAHLLSFRYAGGAAFYMMTRVVPAALLAAVFFPLGYALGRRLEKRLLPLWLARPPLLVPLAGALTMTCLGLTVWLTAAGF
jgi:hypothetical protein